MERITTQRLQAIVDRINKETGSPMASYTRDSDGRLTANIGNYHLDHAYGGVQLCRMSNTNGGVNNLFGGHIPKRELYNLMLAFLDGLNSQRGDK